MNMRNDHTQDLDRAVSALRNVEPPSGEAEQAASRVLCNVTNEYNKVVPYPASAMRIPDSIRSCDDFRALIPSYISGALTSSRRLLLEDHIRDCVTCRKALDEWKGTTFQSPRPAIKTGRASRVYYGAAGVAAAAVLIAVALQTAFVRDLLWPIDVHAVATTINGGLYRIQEENVQPLNAGQRIERNQGVRTGNDSGAVLELADGSRIEMSARSELSLRRMQDGVGIDLRRGNVIVTAAKQRTGHLYVSTKDCTVSVVGTVFSVNAAARGSRVSVIEGQVRVQHGTKLEALSPGQQISTNPIMSSVSIQEEIAWSRDAEAHIAMLREFVAFSEDVGRRIAGTEMRYTSSLVPLVPENTAVLASLPNVSNSVAESYAMFKQRVTENPLLQDWWTTRMASGENGWSVDRMIDWMVRVGGNLGPEIILALPKSQEGQAPVLLANVTLPDSLASAIQAQSVGSSSESGTPVIQFVQNAAELQAAAASSTSPELVIYADRSLLVASVSPAQIQRTLSFVGRYAANPFASTPLYARVEQAYQEGVGWLLAADMRVLVEDSVTSTGTGLENVQQLVIEQKTGSGGAAYQATLAFSQDRQGMSAWLAQPSPMGSLEFVSPNAYGVAAVVTRDPALIVDDLFGFLQSDSTAMNSIEDYQREHAVDIRRDLADPLGNEFLIAVDGPILPSPSWKMVLEVNDAARLQNAIQWSVVDFNRQAAAAQVAPVTLSSDVADGRTFYSFVSEQFPAGIHYTFWVGYMIVAPSRALLMEAIQNHDTGNTLVRAPSFQAQLPADGRDYMSGVVYQNIRGAAEAMPVDLLHGTAIEALPTVVALYGEPNRILMSSKGMLGMNIASFAGIGGMIRAAGVQ